MSPKQPTHKQPVSDNSRKLKAVPDSVSSDSSVEQIREILFGSQMQEYAERFAQLESRLVEDNRQLRESLTAQIEDALKSLKEERDSRKADISDLLDQMAIQGKDLSSKNDQVKDSLGAELDSIKQEIVTGSKSAAAQQKDQLTRFASMFRQMAEQLEQG